MQLPLQKNTQLLAVRDAALQRLARYSGTPETGIQLCYLFRDERFAGVRYRVGPFMASWFWADSVISIHRGTNLIDQFPVESQVPRAA